MQTIEIHVSCADLNGAPYLEFDVSSEAPIYELIDMAGEDIVRHILALAGTEGKDTKFKDIATTKVHDSRIDVVIQAVAKEALVAKQATFPNGRNIQMIKDTTKGHRISHSQ